MREDMDELLNQFYSMAYDPVLNFLVKDTHARTIITNSYEVIFSDSPFILQFNPILLSVVTVRNFSR